MNTVLFGHNLHQFVLNYFQNERIKKAPGNLLRLFIDYDRFD